MKNLSLWNTVTIKPGKLWTPETFLECYCVARKSQSGVRKLICEQERLLVCGFVASLHVLIFAVIGQDTINIPEIFQVFTVFWVTP